MQSPLGVMVNVLPEGTVSITSLDEAVTKSEISSGEYFPSTVLLSKQSPDMLEYLCYRKQIHMEKEKRQKKLIKTKESMLAGIKEVGQ